MTQPRELRFVIIGAGPVGLAVARALAQAGIEYDQVDADSGVGGNWRHGVFDRTHIISSKKTTEFPEYPMPEAYPDFPSRAQMLAYLEGYADHFGLTEHIELDTKVVGVRPIDGDRWEVTLDRGDVRVYRGVLICNGHHWARRWPSYPGELSAELIHSKDYKSPSQLVGKRVLVIGGGNSACDIASEAARVGSSAHLSLRRGYWILPKTMLGRPIAELPATHLPVAIQRLVLRGLLRIVIGRYEDYGLPRPDHRIFDRHPTVNDELLYYLKHGRISPHPDILCFDGQEVEFVDHTRVEVDLVVAATGFEVSYPMLPENLVEVKGAVPQVYGGSMLRDLRHLYLVGWAQPRYGFGPLVSPYADLLAQVIRLQDECTQPIGRLLEHLGDRPPSTHLMDPIATIRKMRRAKRMLGLLPKLDRRLSKRASRATTNPA